MKSKILILASLLFSGGLIMSAVFLASPSFAKADDWGGEVCRATYYDKNPGNGCACTGYTCIQYGYESRRGETCTNGSGWDSSLSKQWGAYDECRVGVKKDGTEDWSTIAD